MAHCSVCNSILDDYEADVCNSCLEEEVCEDCDNTFQRSNMRPWKYEPGILLCDDCYDRRMEDEE